MVAIGERLRELRTMRDMSQREVAEILGISRPAYVKYETNSGGLSRQSLEKLSGLFGVTTDYILCKTNDPRDAGQINGAFSGAPEDALYLQYGLDIKEDKVFLSVASDAKRANVSEHDLRLALEFVKMAKEREEEAKRKK